VSEFLQRAAAEIQNRRLLSRGQKILVAVSGGADSMLLLHALNRLAKQNRWQISVAHFNHQLRGRASEADEKLVRLTAKKLRLKFFCGSADVKAFAAQSKISIEMAARKLRHEFLAATARKKKFSAVALAHHADDQVELFFLRLLRGAGGEGLAGMKWRSPSPADKMRSLIRPLLGFSKKEILEFAAEMKISFREDASNRSADFLRNRIRHELLPLLRKKYQPGVDKTVLRLMEIVGAEAELVGQVAGEMKGTDFASWPVAVQRRVLQNELSSAAVVPDFDLIESLRCAPGKFFSISPALSVARDVAGKIKLRTTVPAEFSAGELRLKFPGRAGQLVFGGKKFVWQFQPFKSAAKLERFAGLEFFDADKIGAEIVLRHWRAGDRFQPIGMKSAVKLQDLFVNAKIPSPQRRRLVLAATAAGEIFWVDGLRIGENFKLTAGTRRRLAWQHSKIAG
jgi:tRNA(Ile)-lysidine synthase